MPPLLRLIHLGACGLALQCGFVRGVLSAQESAAEKRSAAPTTPIPLTAEQTTALTAIDVRIAAIETLAAKVDDAKYKAGVLSAVRDLKRRRIALESNFEPGLYESLMHSVISRYQIVALWLTPPRLPPPSSKTNASERPSGG